MAKPNDKKPHPNPAPESTAKVNASASAESQSETTETAKSKTDDKKIYTENERSIEIGGMKILSRTDRVSSGEIKSQTVNARQSTEKKKLGLKITVVLVLSVAGLAALYNAFKGDAKKDADKSAGEKVVNVTPGYKIKKPHTRTESVEFHDAVFRTQSWFLNPAQSVSDDAVTRLKDAKRLEFSKIRVLVFADYRNSENFKVGETIGSWLRFNEMGDYPTGNTREVERSNIFTIFYHTSALRYAKSIGEALKGYIEIPISYEEHADPDSIIIRITNQRIEFEEETGKVYEHHGPQK